MKKQAFRVIKALFLIFLTSFYCSYPAFASSKEKILQNLENELKTNEKNIEAYNIAATKLNDNSLYDEAIKVCNRALKKDPSNAVIYTELARAYSELGDNKKALKLAEKAIKLDPEYKFAYYLKVIILGDLDDEPSKEIAQAVYKILEIDPKDVMAHKHLIISLYKMGSYRELIKICDKHIELAPDRWVFLKKSDALALLGRGDESISALDEVLKIDPKDLEAKHIKALRLYELGRGKEALDLCNSILKTHPKRVGALFIKGLSLTSLGRYKEAIIQFDKVIELAPENSDGYVNKGFLLNKLGKGEEALKLYDKAIEINPKSIMAYNNKAMYFGDIGQYQKALEIYDDALKIDPSNQLLKANRSNLLKEIEATS